MAILIQDTFTDDDCTYLGDHTPEVGSAWECWGNTVTDGGGPYQCPSIVLPDSDQPRIVSNRVSPGWVATGSVSKVSAAQIARQGVKMSGTAVFATNTSGGTTRGCKLSAGWNTDLVPLTDMDDASYTIHATINVAGTYVYIGATSSTWVGGQYPVGNPYGVGIQYAVISVAAYPQITVELQVTLRGLWARNYYRLVEPDLTYSDLYKLTYPLTSNYTGFTIEG